MKYTWTPVFGRSAYALTGCTTVYEDKYDFSEGRREAKVVQIGRAIEIVKPQFSDCRDAASLQQLATMQADARLNHLIRLVTAAQTHSF